MRSNRYSNTPLDRPSEFRFSIEHFYNTSIHNYASLDTNNGDFGQIHVEKNAPTVPRLKCLLLGHFSRSCERHSAAARMHKTTTRNVPRQRTRPTPPADGPMEEETMANAFRKPIGPSTCAAHV